MHHRDPRKKSTRRHPRYLFDSEIRIQADKRSDPVRSRTLDFSQAGISGIFNADWPVGASVLLQFAVPPAGENVEVRAIVRSRSGARYGFEFADFTSTAQIAIANACEFLSRSR